MADNIRLQDFGSIYSQGLKPFIEDFLKEKAESGESLVYSIEGKIIELEASDVPLVPRRCALGPTAKAARLHSVPELSTPTLSVALSVPRSSNMKIISTMAVRLL